MSNFLRVVNQISESVFGWIEIAYVFVEVVAVIIIVSSLIYGTVRFIVGKFQRKLTNRERFRQYRHGLAKSLLLSLEILIAADVIRTVILEPDLNKILGLGLLVLIRTYLSLSLMVEMEGRWPWQPRLPEEGLGEDLGAFLD
jgi:uncharacterized membrane protein